MVERQFAIVLPETDFKGAALAGERLRKAVEHLEIEANGHRIDATISVGATCYHISVGNRNKSEIVSTTDRALYNFNNTGRNKTSIVNVAPELS